jgi:penicillin amidase
VRLARIIGFGFIGIIALVACAAGVLVWVLVPAENGTISLPGLSAPVAVSFDADGIPTIKAGSDNDAAEALGYLHARDRLFEMDLMRRAAGGTLAQLFGPVALDNDEEMRRLGLRQSAAADETDLSPDARAMLQAYADGVNAWIAQRGRFAAPEFVVFGRPPPWTVTDSLLWGKTLGLWLSGNWRVEVERLALSATMPEQKIDSMWPPDTGLVPEQAALTTPGLAAAAAGSLRWMRHFPEPFTQPQLASNEWAVSGAHTASGKPLLAGDPHLGFGFPSLWYLAKIETPSGTLAGATAPGTPFMVIGHNDHVAWTFTDTGAAVQDVFIEHPAADGKEYQTPDGPRQFITRTERIAVAGHADVLLSVRETRHGPVIGATPDGHALLAVEMANLQPDDTDADGLLLLNRAASVADAEAAAQKITSPVQNLLAADTAGHIGFFTTGKVPIRKAGDGRWPVDGADGLHDWTGFASGNALPHIIDPPGGILLNANNPTVAADFPVLIARDNYPDFRARRIRALLEMPEEQTPASFGRIQLDVTSDFAQRLLPRLLALDVPANDKAAPVAALLRGWPGDMAVDKPQPLIFSAWTDIFVANLLRDNGIGEDDAPVVQDKFLLSLLGPGSAPAAEMWCGGDCNKQLLAALDEAAALLRAKYGADPAAWRWGDAHRAVFAHPLLGRLPVIGRFGRFTITVPGDATTIDVSGSWPATPADFDFTAVHGPELRAVFDLSDLNSSLFVIAPGESGNLLRRHAGDFLVRWRDGQYITLGGSGYGSMTLLPGG